MPTLIMIIVIIIIIKCIKRKVKFMGVDEHHIRLYVLTFVMICCQIFLGDNIIESI